MSDAGYPLPDNEAAVTKNTELQFFFTLISPAPTYLRCFSRLINIIIIYVIHYTMSHLQSKLILLLNSAKSDESARRLQTQLLTDVFVQLQQ